MKNLKNILLGLGLVAGMGCATTGDYTKPVEKERYCKHHDIINTENGSLKDVLKCERDYADMSISYVKAKTEKDDDVCVSYISTDMGFNILRTDFDCDDKVDVKDTFFQNGLKKKIERKNNPEKFEGIDELHLKTKDKFKNELEN